LPNKQNQIPDNPHPWPCLLWGMENETRWTKEVKC